MRLNRYRNLLFYLATIGLFAVLMAWIINSGKSLEKGITMLKTQNDYSQWKIFLDSFLQNIGHPLAILLLQIITIIVVARLFSWICKKINQPAVIGEIIAGIVLGPSLIGMYFPQFSAALFPVQSLGNLQFLSQIGLILFMFVVGMELDLQLLKNRAHEAVVVSHASIIIPFALGMGLAFFMYPSFAPQGVKFISFSLFMGISMSITAFPVLARMVQEKGIYKTPVGALVITCAAVDDITAWSALAAVIAIVKAGSLVSALPTVILAVLYVLIMLKLIRPFLKRIGDLHASRENLSRPIVAIFFLVLLLSSYTTEIIGIHALFGAFIAGTIMPENRKFKQFFIEKVEDIALVLLLPLFFVYTGLRTQIGLLNDLNLWFICGMVIMVAVTGKFAGSAAAARFVGQNWKNSLTIGALMNTRGLVELVALNIGFELGVLSPEIFTMLVIMALVTTFMTSPALELINRMFADKKSHVMETSAEGTYRILLSFGKPEMGRMLLRLAHGFEKQSENKTSITALHLSPGNLFNKYKLDDYEQESFAPIIKESRALNKKIETIFKVSEDIDDDIVEEANKGGYNLLLVGSGHSIFEGSVLGKLLQYIMKILNPDWIMNKVRERNAYNQTPFDERIWQILSKTNIPVGIFLDNGFTGINRVLLAVFSEKDIFLFEFVKKIIRPEVQVTILNTDEKGKNNKVLQESIQAVKQLAPDNIMVSQEMDNLLQFDLVILNSAEWEKHPLLHYTASVLILRK